MARKATRSKNINYVSRDFDSIKGDLINHLKRYFPTTIQDFNDASGGIALIELMAYLGDVLNFQIDRNINETFLSRAVERKNLIAMAEIAGYTPKSVVPSSVFLTVSATFNNAISADTLCTLKKGSRITSTLEPANFEIIQDVDFSSEKNRTTVENDGLSTTYSISGVLAVAGRSKTFAYQMESSPASFTKILLPDRGITEVYSVTASDGTIFTEVDNLAIDTVMIGDKNVTSTSADSEYILKIKRVPNRYTLERESDGSLAVRFGSGNSPLSDGELIPNPEDFTLPHTLKGYVDGFAPRTVDSSNFLKTKSLGNLPKAGSTVTIKYRVGGGIETNVGSNLIKRFVEKKVEFNKSDAINIFPDETQIVSDSVVANNPFAAFGGEDPESNASIRENAISSINSQNRCITLRDYKVRVMAMPAEYGKPFRTLARKDPFKSSGIEILTVSRNSKGLLEKSNNVLKNNMETYIKQFKGVTDSVRFSDAQICNIGVNFTIFVAAGFNKEQSLVKSIYTIRDYFDIRRTDLGITISKSDLLRDLQNLEEIAAIPMLEIINITGTVADREYSSYSINIPSITKNNIMYFPSDVIPEIKYPNLDIRGNIA